MTSFLTTHVLDTAQGIPAANMAIQLWRLEAEGERRTLLKTVHTNSNGRTALPLLAGEEFTEGIYELLFAVGAYFAAQKLPTAHPPFLDTVPLRFGLAEAATHYHIPLLVSPWAYSTYRGS
jgi:5-hydroxyisourate hydrolase